MSFEEYGYNNLSFDQFVPHNYTDRGGIYLLEDPWSAKQSDQFDDCYRGAHPRSYPQGQRPPINGAGRREGMASPYFSGGSNYFSEGSNYYPDGAPKGPQKEGFNQAQWMRNTPNERLERYHLDSAMWDPRPPHYNPSSGMDYSHLTVLGGEFLDEDPRGTPRVNPWMTQSQASTTIDRFSSKPGGSFLDTTVSMRAMLVIILVVILSMWLAMHQSNASLRDAVLLSAMGSRPPPSAS